MPTRSIVPRLNDEGSIGTSVKWWSDAYFIKLHVNGLVFSDNSLLPVVDSAYSLGDSSHRFSNVYVAQNVYINGVRSPVHTASTGTPSGGVDGDVHFQYS
jgi:hypothetical protein